MTDTYTDMLEELKTAYSSLLICQYADKPLAIATIKANIETLLANMLLWKIRDGFDIDTAVGAQLDILGKWIGIDRYFIGQSFGDDNYLAFYDWNAVAEPTDLQGGLQNWNELRETDGAFIGFNDIISTSNALNDDDYRLLLKMKIAKNNTVMSCKAVDDIIYMLFGSEIIPTWETVMKITYRSSVAKYAIIKVAKDKNCLPCPTGVNILLSTVILIDGGNSSPTQETILDGGTASTIIFDIIIDGGNSIDV